MKTKFYGNMEGIALQKHSAVIPSGYCSIGTQGEIWWTGDIHLAPERAKDFPKADRICYHKLDQNLMDEAFK